MDPHLTEMFSNDLSAKVARTPNGMAHLAGSGPAGATCGKCDFFIEPAKSAMAKPPGKCREHQRLMKLNKAIGKIPPNTPACKYFQPK